ncbi:MAG: hypothetical protein ACYSUK_11420 [Planctomycetota bacterium]
MKLLKLARQRNARIFAIFLLIYMGSYCCLRLSKVLVHQEVSLVNRTGTQSGGRAICYFIHQDIGHGSFTDSDNYNRINSPGVVVRLGKFFYYPLVKLEVSYWRLIRPRYIYETTCSE